MIEIIGTSPDGIDAAIRNGLARATETTRGLDRFEVQSVRGHLENRAIAHFQIAIKVGSGTVEAGCKVIIAQRLKRSGMRWNIPAATGILTPRCHPASGRCTTSGHNRTTRSPSPELPQQPGIKINNIYLNLSRTCRQPPRQQTAASAATKLQCCGGVKNMLSGGRVAHTWH